MNYSKDYTVACLEKYFGGPDEVKRKMELCPLCASKLHYIHIPDNSNMIMQESSQCLNCDFGSKKELHNLN